MTPKCNTERRITVYLSVSVDQRFLYMAKFLIYYVNIITIIE